MEELISIASVEQTEARSGNLYSKITEWRKIHNNDQLSYESSGRGALYIQISPLVTVGEIGRLITKISFAIAKENLELFAPLWLC